MEGARLDEIELAVEFVSTITEGDCEAYVSRITGEVHYVADGHDFDPPPPDIDDTDRYAAIPTKFDLGLGKSLALRFADEHMPNDYESIRDIFRRSGAYRRFKDLLESRDRLEQWYAYEAEATRVAVHQWAIESGIQIAA